MGFLWVRSIRITGPIFSRLLSWTMNVDSLTCLGTYHTWHCTSSAWIPALITRYLFRGFCFLFPHSWQSPWNSTPSSLPCRLFCYPYGSRIPRGLFPVSFSCSIVVKNVYSIGGLQFIVFNLVSRPLSIQFSFSSFRDRQSLRRTSFFSKTPPQWMAFLVGHFFPSFLDFLRNIDLRQCLAELRPRAYVWRVSAHCCDRWVFNAHLFNRSLLLPSAPTDSPSCCGILHVYISLN